MENLGRAWFLNNTGARAGDEVVQAFMTPPADAPPSSGGLPLLRQLFGFERVTLAPGASRTLYFTVDASTLALVATNGDRVSHTGAFGLAFTNGVDEQPLIVESMHDWDLPYNLPARITQSLYRCG